MKVLMFGWEFPPHITGGLGTACFGMTKGLAKNGVDVLFVVPKAHGDEDETNVRLLNARDVTVNIDNEKDRSYWDRVQYMEIGSNIIPYVGPERFERLVEEQRATSHFHRATQQRQRKALSTMGIPFHYDMPSLFLCDYRW